MKSFTVNACKSPAADALVQKLLFRSIWEFIWNFSIVIIQERVRLEILICFTKLQKNCYAKKKTFQILSSTHKYKVI